jgi:hypothetical protein
MDKLFEAIQSANISFDQIEKLLSKGKLLFPEGLRYSVKKREYLTSKTGSLFELTSSFSANYKLKKRTYQEKLDKSHTVHLTSEMSNSLHEALEIFESVLCKISFD